MKENYVLVDEMRTDDELIFWLEPKTKELDNELFKIYTDDRRSDYKSKEELKKETGLKYGYMQIEVRTPYENNKLDTKNNEVYLWIVASDEENDEALDFTTDFDLDEDLIKHFANSMKV